MDRKGEPLPVFMFGAIVCMSGGNETKAARKRKYIEGYIWKLQEAKRGRIIPFFAVWRCNFVRRVCNHLVK
ncbi:hypothetical protein I532_12309 [Brevibacillus borstelensis AK1]|uniref:Uncharacterized protein n=1 Tax=Brevibacillus borstelensis AK1 TaxID=1300222 RepID=M8DG64_9BACL|nr:hypothetical protein I532_12309 [Brevibacillus borstelensis AK1]